MRRRAEARSVTEQAAEWLMALEDRGAEVNEAFGDWLRESPTHVQAYLRAATLDTLLKQVDPQRLLPIEKPEPGSVPLDIEPDFALPLLDAEPQPASAPTHTAPRQAWRLAASVAGVTLLLGATWFAFRAASDPWKTYQTAVGEQQSIELEDGSVLTLNTDSTVKVHFAPHQRQIQLVAGEAMFRVQHDPLRPFRVQSGGAVIQAVGTQFNVYRQADHQTTVSVLEGRVAVMPASDSGEGVSLGSASAQSSASGSGTPEVEAMPDNNVGRNAGAAREHGAASVPSAEAPSADAAHAARVFLNAGEELRLADDGEVKAKARADLNKVSAWRQRRLVFVDEPLASVASELNRYNRSPKIRVEGAAAQRRYAVILDADDPESLVTVLSTDPKVTVEHRADEIIIRAR